MAPRKKQAVEIWCGVLKDGSVFSVKIANDATVAKLHQGIAKTINDDPQVHVAAHSLKLFMPEDPLAGHPKLVASSDLIPFLEDGQVPESGFKELVPLWKLNSPNCFGPEFPIKDEEIHVLVKVPGEEPDRKRQRTDEVVWNVADGEYAATDVVTMTLHTPAPDVTSNWIVVPNRFLDGSGVYPPTLHEDLVLYQRRVFQDQWTMMQTCAMDAGAALYVVGAPGTGKSSAAFAFACSQVDRTLWIVVWIHYDSPVERFCIIKFDGDKKATAEVKDAEDITAMLHALETPRRGIVVFFDGYVHSKDASRNAHTKLIQWLCDNRHSRRLLYVSSMTVLAKDYKEDTEPTLEAPASWPPILLTRMSPRQCLRTMKFDVTSWNLDEYIDAVRNDRFYDSVNAQLGASAEAQRARATQLAARAHHVMIKYELAGGSARYMFSKDPGFVMESVTRALQAVPNKRDLMDLLDGGASQQTINRLLAHYIRKGVFETELVSLYVARRIANEIGAAMISSYQKLLTVNPALDGHLLEGWFFLSLASSGLTYCDRDTMKEKEWMKSVPHFFDPYSQPFYLHPGWNVPVKWNQAGYDAVYWEIKPAAEGKAERRRLVFVQMTRASKHKYDPGPFLQIANRLNESEQYASRAQTQREIESTAPLVDRIDLYFVVPLANLETFQVPVAATDFDKRVIQAAVTLGIVDCKVRVVGVDYRMHGSSSDVAPGGRVVRRPAALNAQEYAFTHAVHTARTQLAAASSSQEDDDSG
jgi:hypothetical protein